MDSKQRAMLVNEVNILRKLQNPHIVRYMDRSVDKEMKIIYIVMEFCPGGDLQSLIRETRACRSYIREDQIWLSLSELAVALKDCHCGPEVILHRDIKPGNVFIDGDGHVKLGDFGLARSLTNDLASTYLGTPVYMSPEINAGLKYDEKSDIWALGCVIYEMAALMTPFQGTDQKVLKANIQSAQLQRFSSRYSDSLWNIVSWMLEKDPMKRPNVHQILEYRNVALTLNTNRIRKELGIVREKTHELQILMEKLRERERIVNETEKRIRRGSENIVNF
ncbi:AGC family protein kinase [Tritrichomonas foetus]|uniref:non-specific serine/threonine protein kinase n=1 Tax=Tritrichomonas foetus TaxID=1144522 RepID=A0A1J4JIY5_9EUKA|nr:AGC family protein kinase [Tritrichomonas foetus]|eukprot:OHS97517.1 AGC family protein kinase [Tritrichomonas foetus]